MARLSRLFLGIFAGLLLLPASFAFAQTQVTIAKPTCQITVAPTQISIGGTIVLRWTSKNATSGAITKVGNVGPSGSINLLPSSAAQTTYYGSFTGPGGTANCQATVRVDVGGGTGGATLGTGGVTVQDPGTIPTNPTVPATQAPTISSPSSGLVTCGIDRGGGIMDTTNCQACDLAKLIQNIINFAIGLSIPIAAGLFAWAGVLYFTSGANPNNIGKAKSIFKNAFIGFLIAITGWLIINTVLHVLLDRGNVFSGGNWFTINCNTDPNARPRNSSIKDVLGSLQIFGGSGGGGVNGGGVNTDGTPTIPGSNTTVSGGNGVSAGGPRCLSGFELETHDEDTNDEYQSCVGRDSNNEITNEMAVSCGSGYGLREGEGDVEADSYTGECVNSNGDVASLPQNMSLTSGNGNGNVTLTQANLSSALSRTYQYEGALEEICRDEEASDCSLARAIMMVESSGNAGALSPMGAAGLMQLMPATARGLEPTLRGLSDDQVTQRLRSDTDLNMRLGVRYIAQLEDQFDTVEEVIAAYNGGPRANNESRTCPGQSWWECSANNGYRETRKYVPNVLAARNSIR